MQFEKWGGQAMICLTSAAANSVSFVTRSLRTFAVIAPIMLPAPEAQAAQLLDYAPYAGYGLKKGILGHDFATPLPSCIHGTESTLPASNFDERVSITYTADEYKKAFHVDQKAEASMLSMGSGGEELHIGVETQGASSSFDII